MDLLEQSSSYVENIHSINIYSSIYFIVNDERRKVPLFSFQETSDKWNHLIKYILEYEPLDDDSFYSFDTFEIDPPEPVPLVRQRKLLCNEEINQETMKMFELNDINDNQIKFTKYKLIDKENNVTEVGSHYIKFVMKKNSYFMGFIIIHPEWNGNIQNIRLYKQKISFL
jgi:hypothetical protein